ncbi:MAG: rhomboid family intramembrane serine protease [Thermoguttaceae bacterium]
MGIYDRDYYRQERPSFALGAPRSAVVTLILINAGVFLANALFSPPSDQVNNWLSVRVGTLVHPWLWWQFVTYGFAHASFSHILFNMLALWFLGRDIEDLYGPKEFVRLYLALLAAGSLAWTICNRLSGVPTTCDLKQPGADLIVLGASGAVTGVTILYALNFPRRMLLFMFVLPMPAWVLGVVVVAFDILGATGAGGQHNVASGTANVAYGVHLAGAALAFLYFQQRWNLGRLLPGHWSWPRVGARPRLRVHASEEEDEDDLREEEVDRILDKIHREGEARLTRKERRVLETASREYQRRRRDHS